MNIQRLALLLIILVCLPFFIPKNISAHPGRTASDGCHYCRTNCASWGEVQGARHCHGGYTVPAPTYTAPIVTPLPTPIPTPTPKPTFIPTPTPTPQPTEVSDGLTNGILLIPVLFILWIFYKYRWVIKERFSRKIEGGDKK